MNRLRRAVVLGTAVGTLGLLLGLTNVGLRLEEDLGLRWLFLARGPVAPPSNVVIVSIDRNSAQQGGMDTAEWPPPRHIHAEVFRALATQKVSAIGVDILFDTNRTAIDDDDLADAVARSGNVVLVQHLDRLEVPGADVEVEQLRSPIEKLQKSAIGLAPFPLPEGPLIHYFWPFFPTATGEIPTLPAVVLQIHALPILGHLISLLDRTAGVDTRDMPRRIASVAEARRLVDALRRELGGNREAVGRALALLDAEARSGAAPEAGNVVVALLELYGAKGTQYLNFYGPPGTIETIPFHRLLEEQHLPDVSGKVVFVGEGTSSAITSANQVDTYRTAYSTSEGIDLSGVEISATAFANLLTGRVLKTVGPIEFVALLLVFAIVVGLPARLLPGAYGLLTSALLGALYGRWALFSFAEHSLIVPLVIPLFVQLPLAMFVGLFARYRDIRKQVPTELDPHAAQQLFQGVCLTTDVAGYTALTARLKPTEVGLLLDEYFDMIREVVHARRGMVWGRGGDSTLCLWKGRPYQRVLKPLYKWFGNKGAVDARLRLDACLAAVELRDAIDQFNIRHLPSHRLATRIGLDAGEVGFGPVGGELQVVGNPANTASRIQELNKRLATKLLASTAVVAGLDGVTIRRLGNFSLPGVPGDISIVEIVAAADATSDGQRQLCVQFERALDLFDDGRWTSAAAGFEEILSTNPADGPSSYYRDLCRRRLAMSEGRTEPEPG